MSHHHHHHHEKKTEEPEEADAVSPMPTLVKKKSKKRSRHRQDRTKTGVVTDKQAAATKKKALDLEERVDEEKALRRILNKLHAAQERMYAIRFDDSADPDTRHQELTNFGFEVLRLEKEMKDALRGEIEVFEDQLELQEIGMESVLDPTIHIVVETAGGAFMRTASTPSISGSSSGKSKWQSMFKMFKEKRHQDTVAEGQYVATREMSIDRLDEEITKLRSALFTLRHRKNLKPRDEALLEDMQEQLRLRVQQKERRARLQNQES